MFVSGRACPGATLWLLSGALTAALLANARTQIVAEELDRSSALATCLSKGQSSLVASRSWQYFTGVNLTRSNAVMCQLNFSVATEDDPFATRLNLTSFPTPEPRLLFRITLLQLEERTRNQNDCVNTSFVTLKRSAARSVLLCNTTADNYAWLDDWFAINIYLHSERSVLRFDVSFAVLLAMNVCDGGPNGTATIAVDNVTYAYAPDAWYKELLLKGRKCEADWNYTVRARAADASRLLRVTVLATPSAAAVGCRRLCVERRCFASGDANESVEATEPVTIVYAAVGRCPMVDRTGFTLKLESVLSPSLVGGSEAVVAALVATLIAVILVVVVIVLITIRKRRRREGQRGYMLSEPPSEELVSRRSNEYASIPLSCPDERGLATASVASAQREIAMVDNDLYTESRVV